MGEAIESRGTLCAPSADNVLLAETLTSNVIAIGSCGAGLIAVAWESSIVIRSYEGAGRIFAKL